MLKGQYDVSLKKAQLNLVLLLQPVQMAIITSFVVILLNLNNVIDSFLFFLSGLFYLFFFRLL